MANDLHIKNGITIAEHELIISTSKSGGPGGQHVNKTQSRITVHWNVKNTAALNQEEKNRVLQKLHSRLSSEGELIIHNSSSRSQIQNKRMALENLAELVRKALHLSKKRTATTISKKIKEKRLFEKSHRSTIKKMRSSKDFE